MSSDAPVREAPFALRVTQRKEGRAAIVYRRRPDASGRDRLQRVAALGPLAYQAGLPLLRDAVRNERRNGTAPANGSANGAAVRLAPGPFLPLGADWGARLACYALVASGLQNGERLLRAAEHLRHADADQAAWWLGLLAREDSARPLRALRILTEAVA